jgi:amidase
MAAFDDYGDYDALGLAGLVRRKEVSPGELVDTALAAIAALNPALNAVVMVLEEQARAAAQGALPEGPFTGVPFLIKDLTVSYAGVPTTCGSRFFAGWSRDFDSEILRRWKRAGLIVIGKTNTPELGSSGSTEPVATGATHNPWKLAHTPGGSSGGSAAAVAAGIVPAAHGNDAGGSIRGPASCCGLVGLKPTRGRNPLGPDAGEYWNGLVVEHVLTRSLRDCAALLDCTAGPDVGDPHQAPPPARPFLEEIGAQVEPLRIGTAITGTRSARFSPECQAAARNAAELLEGMGHRVEEAEPDYDVELLGETFMTFFAAAIARDIEDRAAATGRAPSSRNIEANNLWLLERGRKLTALDLLRALTDLNTVSRQFARFFEDHDVWLTPTMATPPPPLGHLYADVDDVELFFERLWAFNPLNSVYNAAGQPAITLPLHMSGDGLPIGVMLGAGFGQESLLFRLSAQLEAAAPWHDRHPPVSLWAKGPVPSRGRSD